MSLVHVNHMLKIKGLYFNPAKVICLSCRFMHAHIKCIVNTCTHQLHANSTRCIPDKYTFVVTAGYKVNYRLGWGDGGV